MFASRDRPRRGDRARRLAQSLDDRSGPLRRIRRATRRRVLEFTTAIFLVHLAGGAILLIGPGQLLLSLLQDFGQTSRHLLELGAGAAMMAGAAVLWQQRRRLAQKDLPDPNPRRKSSALLGATIIVVELPTAFPYFAAIAAIIGSGGNGPGEMLELVIYNLCFVLPLIAIVATLLVAGDQAQASLSRWRDHLQQRWPVVLSVLLLLVGIFVAALGATGLCTVDQPSDAGIGAGPAGSGDGVVQNAAEG